MDDLNISLNPQLLQTLQPLPPLLPSPLSEALADHLSSRPPRETIPYSVLLSISKWSRTSTGQSALEDHAPSLDAHAYDMISLLAGTITSPERRFPPHKRSKGADEIAKGEINDRKAVVAVVNSLLSIGGAGVAAWWAGDVVGWRDEWKVLFALSVAVVIAIAEGILFVIWDSRSKKTRSRPRLARHKKECDEGSEARDATLEDRGLRRRAVASTN